MRRINWTQWIALFVFASMGVSVIFTTYEVFTAPIKQPATGPSVTLRGDYLFLLFEILLGILILLLPSIISRRFKFEIPGLVYILFIVFLYGSIYLGTVQKFYSNVPHWDKILHTFSGAMLGAIGFSFVSLLNSNSKVVMKLKPGFIAVFAFCFAVTMGAFWEVYEYTFDGIMDLNMQRYNLSNGTPLTGRAVLQDTMSDIIVDIVGALIIAIIGYFALKKGRPWMEHFEFKRKNWKKAPKNK
ncbi:hypothetical protein HCJ52_03635 [Listeria sp. FSL L7-1485]|uniref:Uncharacterized protein n=1 Tax=Listeria immobilis TaxID=2713502 RepID=A0A7X0X597_9LIST|nr:hypothetical protein [Listeria immobilis]MBC1482206.1 hypothetical protein [Listeria immobilis]MBC1487881.1 hypothetical protein [Listeria immobilis]MBC1505599.1 hypothetical protein [Listeria immobilis]MBC1510832.1 hypothetical protein [Listeria immobilis]MBC1514692.1 hypothetical protein [Listeria immobilis]